MTTFLARKLAIAIILFIAIAASQIIAAQDTTATSTQTGNPIAKDTIPVVEIYLANTTPTIRAVIGGKLRLHITNPPRNSSFSVFLKEVRVASVHGVEGQPGWYWFQLTNKIDDLDSISTLFNERNKQSITVPLSIRYMEGSKILTTVEDFIVVFYEDRKQRMIYAFSGVGLIVLILIGILSNTGLTILRDKTINEISVNGVISDDAKAPFSLSRTQLAYWTIIVVIAYIAIWIESGAFMHLTAQVLTLLGISAATTVGANMIDNADIRNARTRTRHQEHNDTDSFVLNIISDKYGPSVYRFQNVIFSIVIGSYFLYRVFLDYEIPDLDTNLMVLMGISSTTYLAIKNGENSGESNAVG